MDYGNSVRVVEFMFKHQDCCFTPLSLAVTLKISPNSMRRMLLELYKIDCVKRVRTHSVYNVEFDQFQKFQRSLRSSKNKLRQKKEQLVIM